MGKADMKEVLADFSVATKRMKGAPESSAKGRVLEKLGISPDRVTPCDSMKVSLESIVPGENIRQREITPENDPKLSDLAESIRTVGVLEPVIVTRVNVPNKLRDKFVLVAGFRRFAAAKLAHVETIPVIVYSTLTEAQMLEIQISENIHRADLAPTEEATVYKLMAAKLRYTHEEIALRVGKSPKHVGRYIKLLSLPEGIRERIDGGEITLAKAQFFCSLPEVVITDILDSWRSCWMDPSYSLKDIKNKVTADYIKKLGKNLIRFDRGMAYTDKVYKKELPACTVCPYKGQLELFEEHDAGEEVCPFRPCLSRKNEIVKEAQEAAAKRAAAKAAKKGGGSGEAGKVISSKKKRSPWEIRQIIRDAKEAAAAKYYAGVYFGEPPVNTDELNGKEITPADVLLVVEDIIEEHLLNDDVGEPLCRAYFGKDAVELKESGSVRELLFAAILATIVYHGADPHGYYKNWPGYKDAPKELLEQARRDALEANGISEAETEGIGE